MTRGRRLRIAAAIGLAASLFALAAQWAGWLELYELRTIDLMMRARGPAPADPRVAICDIDAAGVDHFGQWPWPRHLLARLVDRLAEGGASVIAFDVVFSEPSRGGTAEDEALAAAVRRAGNVVLGYYFRREEGLGGDPSELLGTEVEQVIEPPGGYPIPEMGSVEPNIPLLAAAAASQGFFSIDPDADGVLRHYALVASFRQGWYPALAVRAVQRAAGRAPLSLTPYQGRLPGLAIGGRPVPADELGRLWVNYRGPAGTFATVSALDVLEGRAPAGIVQDRIVFIGASETGIADLRATPLAGVVPGVEVHATVADNLLNDRFIHDSALHLSLSLAAALLLGPLVAVMVPLFPRSAFGFGAAAVAAVGWLAAAWAAFSRLDAHLQVLSPFLAGALAYAGAAVYEAVFVEAKARRIKKTFQQFVSAAVVEEMLRDPDKVTLGGERRDMTVMFADIRGFTSIAETLEPEQVVRLLNEFLTPMTRVVQEAGGTLDKYMGDALMAFFGAPVAQPDHAARACRAALAMREELIRLNASWRTAGTLPAGSSGIGIGIGLNSGMMSVGNMGSDAVFDYTVIGDHVNLGSRLEGLNKIYGTEIIVSEHTAAAAGGAFVCRELDRVRVKGKLAAVGIHELVCHSPASEAVEALLARFASGLAAYRDRDFESAEKVFALTLETAPQDGPARLYLERCRALAASPPPAGWDAVEVLTAK
ncbi:MAG TPA: adenylate/guanylate cyclase domain-containing protein [Candidatus Polarisedimenticolia bacterium]|nr:adenylate/guanylate cyclase domain-containing protein [Candidatus Polarisedimenticolia bacterium]